MPSWQHFYRRVLHDLGQFLRSLQLSWTDIATERNLLQPRIIYLCDRFSAHIFASRAFVTVKLAANMRGGMWTQIVCEVKTACTS